MASKPSKRILDFVDALPLRPGMRVLEIGCGPGVAAREVARRIGTGFILAIDRSDKAISMARKGSKRELEAGVLQLRTASAETFELMHGEDGFDLCFAMRVGVFDGRHPKAGPAALHRVKVALRPDGRFFIDTGDPLHEIMLR